MQMKQLALGIVAILSITAPAAHAGQTTVKVQEHVGVVTSNDVGDAGKFEGQFVELGYQIPSSDTSTWILALEIGRASARLDPEFGPHPKHIVDTKWSAVAKGGYGLRLGESSLAIASLGFGRASAVVDVRGNSERPSAKGSVFTAEIEGQFAVSSQFFVTGGVSHRVSRFDFDDFDARLNDEVAARSTALTVGALLKL